MLRTALSAKAHLAARWLTAVCGRAAFPIVESSAQHIFGRSDIATVASRPDQESLDSADTYVEAGTELRRCVLDRVWPANRPSLAGVALAAPSAWLESSQPGRNMLRW
jgi:hypothetical protein